MKQSKNKNACKQNKKEAVKTPPPYTFLSGAEQYKQDFETKAWLPSDAAVEEMREFSEENRQ